MILYIPQNGKGCKWEQWLSVRDNLLYLTRETDFVPDNNERTIRNSRLNEDKRGRDELYAKVKLRPKAERTDRVSGFHGAV